MNLATKATIIASICAFFLAVVKFIVGIASGSVAVLASAIDSMMDVAMSAFNALALKKSAQSPSQRFNFGFSKIEALMGVVEGVLIISIAGFIFYESVGKIHSHNEIENLIASVWVMVFALGVTAGLVGFLSIVAKKTKSIVVESDCLHYKTDCLTNLATLIALGIIYLTGWHIIDAIFGIVVSLYIAFSASKIIKKSLLFLMDEALDSAQVETIERIISEHSGVISFHDLKTRKSPERNYLGVHLVLSPDITLLSAHEIANDIERNIRKVFCQEKWEMQIHLDPYDDQHEEISRL